MYSLSMHDTPPELVDPRLSPVDGVVFWVTRSVWSTEEEVHMSWWDLDITGPVSLVIQVMSPVVRRSSICHNSRRRIIRGHTSTMDHGWCVLVINRWLQGVELDTTPWHHVVTSRSPVSMIINSSELRDSGFKFRENGHPHSNTLKGSKRGIIRTCLMEGGSSFDSKILCLKERKTKRENLDLN